MIHYFDFSIFVTFYGFALALLQTPTFFNYETKSVIKEEITHSR